MKHKIVCNTFAIHGNQTESLAYLNFRDISSNSRGILDKIFLRLTKNIRFFISVKNNVHLK